MYNSQSDLRSMQEAFTLIEMLVVVSIIALLASLMVPVVSTVYEKAGKTQCMNVLRNFYQLSMVYSVEHDGHTLPQKIQIPSQGINKNWFHLIRPYMGEKPLHCPKVDDGNWSYGFGINYTPSRKFGDGTPNRIVENSVGKNYRFGEIRDPAGTVSFIDFDHWTFQRDLVYRIPTRFPYDRHGKDGKVPAVFFDGRAQVMAVDEALIACGFEP